MRIIEAVALLKPGQQKREHMFKVYIAVFKVYSFDYSNIDPVRAVVTLHNTRFNTNSSALLCPQSVPVCCMWLTRTESDYSLYSISQLVFVFEMDCVNRAVRTECLHTI